MTEADTGFGRPVEPYPDDSATSLRVLPMPVGRPERAPRTGTPRPGCNGCGETPCVRHSAEYLRTSLGLPPAAPAAPDDSVHDWTPVR